MIGLRIVHGHEQLRIDRRGGARRRHSHTHQDCTMSTHGYFRSSEANLRICEFANMRVCKVCGTANCRFANSHIRKFAYSLKTWALFPAIYPIPAAPGAPKHSADTRV